MHIGFDAKRLYCNFTGLGNYSRTLVKNLYEYYPDSTYSLYSPRLSRTEETDYFYKHLNIRTSIADAKLKAYWRSFSISHELRADNIQLYHGLSNELPFNIKKSGAKSIVTIHDLIFKRLPDTYRLTDRLMYDLKFKTSCQQADRVIAISKQTKADIMHYYNIPATKIDIIYQSCNTLFYKETPTLDLEASPSTKGLPDDFLLFVGTVEPRKNVALILESYAYLANDFKIPLVIVGGSRSYKQAFLKLIAEKGLQNKIIWLNNVWDNLSLKALYQKAQALIYPSFFEGFGLPVAEALLCKTPVIAAQTSSLPEAGGPDSIYINPTDSKGLAFAIEEVLTNNNLRLKMQSNGYKYALKHFSPEQTSRQLMTSYTKTLAQP